ncbi:MAG: hypothetical protein U1F67_20290 [Rubrivivax sp.]
MRLGAWAAPLAALLLLAPASPQHNRSAVPPQKAQAAAAGRVELSSSAATR